jgi:hypothetical protein
VLLFHHLELTAFHNFTIAVGKLEDINAPEIIVEVDNGTGTNVVLLENPFSDEIKYFKRVTGQFGSLLELKINIRGSWVGVKTNHLHHIGLGRGTT